MTIARNSGIRLSIPVDARGGGAADGTSLRRIVVLMILSGLLACCLLSQYEAAGVASLVFFMALIVFFLANRPQLIVKYLPFFFAVVANVLGCAVCELSPLYLEELGLVSFYAGSLPLLVLSRCLFLAILLAYDVRFGVEKSYSAGSGAVSENAARWINVLSFGTLVAFACLFSQVAAHPSFLEGLNRFSYSSTYQNSGGIMGILESASDYLFLFCVLGIRYGSRKCGIAGISLYILYLVWTGTKFGSLLTVLCVFAFVFYDKVLTFDIAVTRRVAFGSCAAILVLVAFALVLFSFTSDEDPIDYFSHRIAEQGQLWWSVYASVDGEGRADELSDEVDGTLRGSESIKENVGSDFGIYKMMYLVAPKKMIDNHLSVGARYTEAGYACAYYYLGVMGPPVFSLITGCLAAAVVNALLRALGERRIVSSVLLLRLLTLSRTAVGMFIFIGFFDIVSILSYGVLILGFLMRLNGRLRKGGNSAMSIDRRKPEEKKDEDSSPVWC